MTNSALVRTVFRWDRTHEFDVRRRLSLRHQRCPQASRSTAATTPTSPAPTGAPRGIQGIWMERVDLSGTANATFTLQGQHSNVGPASRRSSRHRPRAVRGRRVHHGQHDIRRFPDDARCAAADVRQRRERRVCVEGLVRRSRAAPDEPRAEQGGVRLVGVRRAICRTLRRGRRPVDAMVERVQRSAVDLRRSRADRRRRRSDPAMGDGVRSRLPGADVERRGDVDDDPQCVRRRRRESTT